MSTCTFLLLLLREFLCCLFIAKFALFAQFTLQCLLTIQVSIISFFYPWKIEMKKKVVHILDLLITQMLVLSCLVFLLMYLSMLKRLLDKMQQFVPYQILAPCSTGLRLGNIKSNINISMSHSDFRKYCGNNLNLTHPSLKKFRFYKIFYQRMTESVRS